MDSLTENHKEIIKNNRLMLKPQRNIEAKSIIYLLNKLSRLHWVLTMITVESIDSIEAYAYGTNEEVIYKKEEIKCINIIKHYKKIINFDNFTKENKQT